MNKKTKVDLSGKTDEEVLSFLRQQYQNLTYIDVYNITQSIKDENIRFNFIKYLMIKDYFYLSQITKLINDKLKIKLIHEMFKLHKNQTTITYIICLLKNDKDKLQFFPYLSIFYKSEIIKTFNKIEIIKRYIDRSEYEQFKAPLILSTKDQKYIKEQFINTPNIKLKHDLLELIDDNNFKFELINTLDKKIQYFLLSNNDEFYDNYLKIIDEAEITNAKIDENITIGIELECCNKDIDQYKYINNILKDFKVTSDASVKSGFEIISPILHFTKTDMDKLYSVCEILKTCSFYTDESCGGHIHIGSDYLKTSEEFYMLLYLYINYENIIYHICNKDHSTNRKNIKEYAKKTKDIYLKAIKENKFKGTLTKNDIIQILYKMNPNKYSGINFQNLINSSKNTIEFRMPNGEIEFNELFYNIKLFTKLIQRSHELTYNTTQKTLVMTVNNFKNEKEKLENFLNILFDTEEEKNVYRNRYKTNINFIKNLAEDLFHKNNQVEIDENNQILIKKK